MVVADRALEREAHPTQGVSSIRSRQAVSGACPRGFLHHPACGEFSARHRTCRPTAHRTSNLWAYSTPLFHTHALPPALRTVQNYLVWRLVLDRISSLSQRFKEARANYRKVRPRRGSSCPVLPLAHSVYGTERPLWAKHQGPPWGQSHERA